MSDPSFLKIVDKLHGTIRTLSYYQVLGIQEDASSADIKKAFLNLTRQFHPDKHHSSDAEELAEKLNTIFASITEAYSTLSHPGKRQEYDQERAKTANRIASSDLSKEERAELLCVEGQEKLQMNEFEEAQRLFSQAIYLDEKNPVCHYCLGRVHTSMKQYSEAARALQNAIKLNPGDAHYHIALGYAFIEIGLLKRAQGSFQRALRILPDNVKAIEGLKKVDSLTK